MSNLNIALSAAAKEHKVNSYDRQGKGDEDTMATLDYIQIPPGATRLRSVSSSFKSESDSTGITPIRPAAKITTSIPHPSPPSSPSMGRRRRPSMLSSASTLASAAASSSLTSPTMSFIPQLLLSSAMPPMSPTTASLSNSSTGGGSNIRKKLTKENVVLLSSNVPLSLPIMSTNFKRFVSIVGPVFWMQDRIEEIVLWKRGWRRTAVWMAAYAFICFYPRLILLLPHIALISIILATYPYPSSTEQDPLYRNTDGASSTGSTGAAAPVTEGSVPWQANIQGIQNLMGAVADAHDLIEPYIYHFQLTPQHIRPLSSSSSSSSTSSSQPTSTKPRSPYTAHILTVLFITFFPLLFIVHLPWFPIRETALLAGLGPLVITHPVVRKIGLSAWPFIVDSIPLAAMRVKQIKGTLVTALRLNRWFGVETKRSEESEKTRLEMGEEGSGQEQRKPFAMIIRRLLDDDRLSDECWNSEMREVSLWENERYGGPLPSDSPTMVASTFLNSSASPVPVTKGWSKQNLRQGERGPWTRGSDGGIEGGLHGRGNVEVGGEVSSNLTFSLAPGWRFIESEDWRKDLQCAWSGVGSDPDGWVYTNDAWLGARPTPYTSGGGSVTRRRRWIRRVWWDKEKAREDG